MIHHTIRLFHAALLAGLLGAPAGFNPSAAAQAAGGAVSKPADKITELFGDAVLARGKGVEIKRSEFDTALMSIKANAAAQGRNIPPEFMSTLERQVLNDLIGMQLLLNKASAADKARGREQFEKSFQKFKTDANVTDAEYEERLALQLRAQGLSREQWEKQRVDQMTVGFTLERELKVSVSDAEARKFYDENPSRFEEPEMVRASHILLSTRDAGTGTDLPEAKKQEKRKQMEAILKRARAGEDFAKLAKELSEDPGSKDKGGEYTFPRGQMVPAFESAAFSLSPNQISDIVTTQFGYHIIKLSEKIPARKLEFTKVADEVKEGLKQQEIQKHLRDFVEKLKEEAGVEILDEKLKMPVVGPGAKP